MVGLPLIASMISGPFLLISMRSNEVWWVYRAVIDLVLIAFGLLSLRIGSLSTSKAGYVLLMLGIFCVSTGGLAFLQGAFLDLIVGF